MAGIEPRAVPNNSFKPNLLRYGKGMADNACQTFAFTTHVGATQALGAGMPTFVALLRGVNVGKAKRVPMADLRSLLNELGYTGIATLLNSGNAVFRATRGVPTKHAARIAGAIVSKLKVDVPVVVKSANEFSAIVAENSLAEKAKDHSRLLVAFVQDPKALPGLAVVEKHIVPPERFLVGKGAAYLHCASGILESKAGKALLGNIGEIATTRNWATVLKLRELVSETDD